MAFDRYVGWDRVAGTFGPTVMAFLDGRYARVVSGVLTVVNTVLAKSTTGSAFLQIDVPAGSTGELDFLTSALKRWAMYKDSVAESGSNAGSNFAISRFTDAGAYIDNPLTIFRSSGVVSVSTQLNAPTPANPNENSVVVGNTSWVQALMALAKQYDMNWMQFGEATVRATGTGDFATGIKLQRAVTFTSVTFRCATADASGSSTFELQKNGVSVSGTPTTVASGSQVAGATTTGSWSFAVGDVLRANITAVGTTPGKGLVVDLKGTWT